MPVQNGAYVYRIPPYGYFKTSAPMPSGWVADEYCYVHGKVEQPLSTNEDATGMVWNDGVDTGSENNTPLPAHRSLFIGTEKQFQLTGRVGSWVGPLNPTTMKYRLQGRDFRYKDLSKHNFSHMNLVGTNLSCVLHGANLQGANLRYAVVSSDLTHASLRGANLQEADLLDGTWIDTDFTHADMRRAHLHRVEFQQAKLTGANLRGLQYDSATKWPHGFNPKQHGAILVPSVSIE
ncbi:MAG: pentapeptide repeat-containing protein [Abitibacteriaceae bacterium]|nr:pentapeptide repeat-containing protein [Abditibacteriaceae bacterium]